MSLSKLKRILKGDNFVRLSCVFMLKRICPTFFLLHLAVVWRSVAMDWTRKIVGGKDQWKEKESWQYAFRLYWEGILSKTAIFYAKYLRWPPLTPSLVVFIISMVVVDKKVEGLYYSLSEKKSKIYIERSEVIVSERISGLKFHINYPDYVG